MEGFKGKLFALSIDLCESQLGSDSDKHLRPVLVSSISPFFHMLSQNGIQVSVILYKYPLLLLKSTCFPRFSKEYTIVLWKTRQAQGAFIWNAVPGFWLTTEACRQALCFCREKLENTNGGFHKWGYQKIVGSKILG